MNDIDKIVYNPGRQETWPRPVLSAVGGLSGRFSPLNLGFLICTREATLRPSTGLSPHTSQYQDSRLECSWRGETPAPGDGDRLGGQLLGTVL